MILILPTPFKFQISKQTSWINSLLMSCTVVSGTAALAQTSTVVFTTRQDELFKEAYRLAIPQDVLDYPWMSSIVDYDNDGSLDVILYGHHSADAYIWRGAKSDAEYLDAKSWVFGVRDPIWLDVDRDGDIDGVGTEGSAISNELFINDGNGNFEHSDESFSLPIGDLAKISGLLPMPSHIPPSKHPLDAKLTKVHYVDLNNDGKPELIASMTGQITFKTDSTPVTRYSGYSWVLEEKDGDWIDVTETLGLRDGLEQQFFPEDIDMDGDMDLVDFFTESLYRNDEYRFTKVNTSPIFGGRRPYDGDGEIDVIDLDNNGYRDFIFGGDHSASSGTWLNVGNFSFEALQGSVIRASRRERKFGDLDGDGDVDMVANDGKEMVVYDNVTPNPGIHVTFDGDYFGTRLQLRDGNGSLVFNIQLFQHQNRGMSQRYTNTLHVGGVSGPVQMTVNNQSPVIYDPNTP